MKKRAVVSPLPPPSSSSSISPLRSSVVFIVTLLWFGVFAMIGMDPHHDGIMLKCAADVAAGKRLFAETFCQYGDLTILLQALALRITGVKLLTIRLLTVLFYAGSSVLVDRLWGRFLRGGVANSLHLALFWGMVPFTMVTFHPWSSVYALFFMLLAAELLLRSLECGENAGPAARWYVFASGCAAGCAFGCRTPVGVVTGFAVAAVFLLLFLSGKKEARRQVGVAATAWGLGALAWPVIGALRITFTGAWSAYLHQCFRFVGRFAVERGGIAAAASGPNGGLAAAWRKVSESLFPFNNSLWPIDLFYGVLPLAVLAAGALIVCRFRRQKERNAAAVRLPALILFALVSWHQFYPVPCVRHLYWASIPMFGAFVWLLQEMWDARTELLRHRIALRIAVVVLLLFPAAAVAWRLYSGAINLEGFSARRQAADQPVLCGMRLNREEWELCRLISTVTRELPSGIARRGFLNATADGLFSLLMPEPAPPFRHPMFVNWNRDVYPDYPEKLAEFIAERRPVVLTQVETPPFPGSVCIGGARLRGTLYLFWITPAAQ